MIKAIVLTFTIGLSTSELILTQEYFYIKTIHNFATGEKIEYRVMDLKNAKTHFINGKRTGRKVVDSMVHKDNWASKNLKFIDCNKKNEMVSFAGCDCVLLEEFREVALPSLGTDKNEFRHVSYSYQCDFKPLIEYLELDEQFFKLLFLFKNKVDSHPFELASWTGSLWEGNRFYIGGKVEHIEYIILANISDIEQLLNVKLGEDQLK